MRPTADRVREAVISILGDVSGARVLDPDGNNVEAVCHRPE